MKAFHALWREIAALFALVFARFFNALSDLSVAAKHTVLRFPLITLCDTALVFTGHLSRLFAFLVPIKVLYIAATPTVPAFIANWTGGTSKEAVVLVLALSAAALYLIAHLCESGSKKLKLKVAESLDASQSSGTITERTPAITRKSYKQVVTYLAAALFQGILLPLNVVLIDWFGALLLAVVVLGIGLAYLGNNQASGDSDKPGGQLISSWQSLSFLVAFGFVLIGLLNDQAPSALLAVISLVCARLQINQAALIVRVLDSRLQTAPSTKSRARDAAESREPAHADLELPGGELLGACLHTAIPLDSGKALVRSYLVNSASSTVLVSQFSGMERFAAGRVAASSDLIKSTGLSPVLVGERRDRALTTQLFTGVDSPISDVDHASARRIFLGRCMAVEPTKEWWGYATKEPVYRRLKLPDLNDLDVGRDCSSKWRQLHEIWPDLQQFLSGSVHTLVVRSGPGLLAMGHDSMPLALYWDGLAVEPAGVSWEGESYSFDPIAIKNAAGEERAEMAGLPDVTFTLGYSLGRLEAALLRRNQFRATQLVDDILSSADAIL